MQYYLPTLLKKIFFVTLLLLLPPFVQAQTVFESATGPTISSGILMGSENWLFHNFEVTETIKNPEVGMFFTTYAPTQVFAAIVALDGKSDAPDSIDLSTPDLLETKVFDISPTGSEGGDRSVVMPLTLEPGWYALGFGTGGFGAEDIAYLGTLALTTDLVPDAMPYGQFQSNHFAHPNTRHYYNGFSGRFFVSIPPPSADFDYSGFIDNQDLQTWQEAFGTNDSGDADGDHDSDGNDFLKWQREYTPAPLITNGDFETGFLGPWNEFVTPNGSGSPRIQMFDVDGDGSASNAMRIRTGLLDYPGVSPAGAGIEQTFNLDTAGDYSVQLDIASSNEDTGGNSAPGTFEVYIDGSLVDSVDMTGTSIQPGEIFRDSLAGIATDLTVGEHTLQILITRPALNSRQIYQYVDNIVLKQVFGLAASHSVPEPGTALLLVTAGICFLCQKRCHCRQRE